MKRCSVWQLGVALAVGMSGAITLSSGSHTFAQSITLNVTLRSAGTLTG